MHRNVISKDIVDRLAEISTDEEIPARAREELRNALVALRRDDVDPLRAWRLFRAAEDLRLGVGSIESVVTAARACHPLVTKKGAA